MTHPSFDPQNGCGCLAVLSGVLTVVVIAVGIALVGWLS